MGMDHENGMDQECAFSAYLTANAAFWGKAADAERPSADQPEVLIEGLVQHSGYMLLNAIVGRHMMNIRQQSGAVLLPDRKDPRWERLFRSFGVEKFYYLSDRKRSLLAVARNTCRAAKLLLSAKSIPKLLKLKHEGFDIGTIVYDTYLRSTGYGSMERMNLAGFRILVRILGHHDYLEKLFRSQTFSILVQSERQFVPGAVLCQTALCNEVEVISRGGGPQSFTLQRYASMDDVQRNTHRHEKRIFDHIMANKREDAVRIGAEIIEKRFQGDSAKDDIPDAAFAFKKGAERVSRSELCKRFGWEENKPIVAVMANMLTDGVFTNRWRLFQDNLVWLRETLTCIRDLDHVNWLVKGHPSDKKNRVKTPTSGECARIAGGLPHVRYMPEDVTNVSLPGILDAVLTGHGSAGIEYSCFGIPCVIAGESLYSGRGFVHEPQTQEEYFSILRRIETLKRLDAEQIERAKLFTYVYLVLSKVNCDLVPPFSVFADWDEAQLWADATALLDGKTPADDKLGRMMAVQDAQGYRHMLNYDWADLMPTPKV